MGKRKSRAEKMIDESVLEDLNSNLPTYDDNSHEKIDDIVPKPRSERPILGRDLMSKDNLSFGENMGYKRSVEPTRFSNEDFEKMDNLENSFDSSFSRNEDYGTIDNSRIPTQTFTHGQIQGHERNNKLQEPEEKSVRNKDEFRKEYLEKWDDEENSVYSTVPGMSSYFGGKGRRADRHLKSKYGDIELPHRIEEVLDSQSSRYGDENLAPSLWESFVSKGSAYDIDLEFNTLASAVDRLSLVDEDGNNFLKYDIMDNNQYLKSNVNVRNLNSLDTDEYTGKEIKQKLDYIYSKGDFLSIGDRRDLANMGLISKEEAEDENLKLTFLIKKMKDNDGNDGQKIITIGSRGEKRISSENFNRMTSRAFAEHLIQAESDGQIKLSLLEKGALSKYRAENKGLLTDRIIKKGDETYKGAYKFLTRPFTRASDFTRGVSLSLLEKYQSTDYYITKVEPKKKARAALKQEESEMDYQKSLLRLDRFKLFIDRMDKNAITRPIALMSQRIYNKSAIKVQIKKIDLSAGRKSGGVTNLTSKVSSGISNALSNLFKPVRALGDGIRRIALNPLQNMANRAVSGVLNSIWNALVLFFNVAWPFILAGAIIITIFAAQYNENRGQMSTSGQFDQTVLEETYEHLIEVFEESADEALDTVYDRYRLNAQREEIVGLMRASGYFSNEDGVLYEYLFSRDMNSLYKNSTEIEKLLKDSGFIKDMENFSKLLIEEQINKSFYRRVLYSYDTSVLPIIVNYSDEPLSTVSSYDFYNGTSLNSDKLSEKELQSIKSWAYVEFVKVKANKIGSPDSNLYVTNGLSFNQKNKDTSEEISYGAKTIRLKNNEFRELDYLSTKHEDLIKEGGHLCTYSTTSGFSNGCIDDEDLKNDLKENPSKYNSSLYYKYPNSLDVIIAVPLSISDASWVETIDESTSISQINPEHSGYAPTDSSAGIDWVKHDTSDDRYRMNTVEFKRFSTELAIGSVIEDTNLLQEMYNYINRDEIKKAKSENREIDNSKLIWLPSIAEETDNLSIRGDDYEPTRVFTNDASSGMTVEVSDIMKMRYRIPGATRTDDYVDMKSTFKGLFDNLDKIKDFVEKRKEDSEKGRETKHSDISYAIGSLGVIPGILEYNKEEDSLRMMDSENVLDTMRLLSNYRGIDNFDFLSYSNIGGGWLLGPETTDLAFTSAFTHYRGLTSGAHYALDFGLPKGTPLYSILSGQVEYIEDGKSETCPAQGTCAGNEIRIASEIYDTSGTKHKVVVQYYHLDVNFRRGPLSGIKVGDEIESGALIAYSGNTGRSTGAHLHLAAWIDKGGTRYEFNPAHIITFPDDINYSNGPEGTFTKVGQEMKDSIFRASDNPGHQYSSVQFVIPDFVSEGGKLSADGILRDYKLPSRYSTSPGSVVPMCTVSPTAKRKSYMASQMITNRSSLQWKLLTGDAIHYDNSSGIISTDTSTGVVMKDGRYGVAMAATYGKIGDKLDLYFDDGKILPVILMDQKSATYYDGAAGTMCQHDDGSVVEFVIDGRDKSVGGFRYVTPNGAAKGIDYSKLPSNVVSTGNFNEVGKFSGQILYVRFRDRNADSTPIEGLGGWNTTKAPISR